MGRKLHDLDKKLWANDILWRLAVALELINEEDKSAVLDPDEVLETAERFIENYLGHYCE